MGLSGRCLRSRDRNAYYSNMSSGMGLMRFRDERFGSGWIVGRVTKHVERDDGGWVLVAPEASSGLVEQVWVRLDTTEPHRPAGFGMRMRDRLPNG